MTEDEHVQMRRSVVKESCALVEELGEEIYYGLNLKIVLSEVDQRHRDSIRYLIDKARVGRNAAA